MKKKERYNLLHSRVWPPLGVLYIASLLKNNLFEVDVYEPEKFLYGIDVIQWLNEYKPDILGVSLLTLERWEIEKVFTLLEKAKQIFPDMLIILGNHHSTANAQRIIERYKFIDIIVRGEGEETFLETVKFLTEININNKNALHGLKNIRGITFKIDEKTVSTEERGLIECLDSLSFPYRKLWNFGCTLNVLNLTLRDSTTVLTTRGCIYNCVFCSRKGINKNIMRKRSIDNISDELKMIRKEGYKNLIFMDDCFTTDAGRVIEICNNMVRNRLKFNWSAQGRCDTSSYEMFRSMARAGCRLVFLGIESGSEKVLKFLNKQTSIENIVKTVKIVKKAGIPVILGYFIVGVPGEDNCDLQETLRLAKCLDLDYCYFNILTAYPNTPLMEYLKQNSAITEEDSEYGIIVPLVDSKMFPMTEITKLIRGFQIYYYRQLHYINIQILRLFTNFGRMKLFLEFIKSYYFYGRKFKD